MAIVIILANTFTPLADFYIENIYPYLMRLSAITSLLPFSLGEFVIITLIIIAIAAIISFAVLMISKKNIRKKICRVYASVVAAVCAVILMPCTFNCFVMYHGTPISEKYFSDVSQSSDNLVQIHNELVANLNRLNAQIKRDEYGRFRLTCDLNETAKQAMQNIGGQYPQLDGYYPDAKPVKNSYILSQEYTTGIFLPFTLEANYNNDMCDINLPFTVCHELAHLKGIMNEDEANFIAFMACINSDNAEFQYSGYLNALEYIISYTNVHDSEAALDWVDWEIENRDMWCFLPEDYWEENEDKEIIPTEVVETVADVANDTYLKVNGVSDGIESYSRVVDLIVLYYNANPVE